MIRISTETAARTFSDPYKDQSDSHVSPYIPPFTLIYDKQEQATLTFEGIFELRVEQHEPYKFRGLVGRSKHEDRPIIVKTKKAHLKTGDYSIEGFEHLVTVERKSIGDLYGTLSSGRDRFEREHERMLEMIKNGGRCCVVIEADYVNATTTPPDWSNLHPHSIIGYATSWPFRFSVPWVWATSRRGGEEYTYRFLEMFWREQQQKIKEEKQLTQ